MRVGLTSHMQEAAEYESKTYKSQNLMQDTAEYKRKTDKSHARHC